MFSIHLHPFFVVFPQRGYRIKPTHKSKKKTLAALGAQQRHHPKALGNVDNEGLIGRAREDHRFGFRRANIFRQYQADLGLVLAALGAQQRHHPKHFSFAIPRSRRS